MSEALVSLALETLRSVIDEGTMEMELPSYVDPGFKRLKDQMSEIKDFLPDAEEKRANNREVRHWLEALEDILLEAQDSLDELITDMSSLPSMPHEHREVCTSLSMLYNRLISPKKTGGKINEIGQALNKIIGNTPRGIKKPERPEPEESQETILAPRRETGSSINEEEIIGRKHDKDWVLKKLLDLESKEENGVVSVITIVGGGGIGKTALAECVFKDDVVVSHFCLRMWISVSQVFDLRQIVWGIIESATPLQRPDNLTLMDQLVSHLGKTIEGKRYLLVLDDVWNEDREKWDDLLRLVKGGAKGSKILVTTRSPIVARIPGHRQEVHPLESLGESESWSLFERFAFRQGQEPGDNIKRIGRRILGKCEGNPLAIKTIGSMLYFKDSETEWSSFEINQLSRISQMEDTIMPVLKLSYDILPSFLKCCFAYCAVFPKQHEIDVKTLINLWIAQGFISSSYSYLAYDLGYHYFLELHFRNFFQVIEEDENGNVTKCKMQGLMHDLAVFVVGTGCLTLKLNEEITDPKTRHVSFHFHLDAPWQVPTSLDRAKRIRTFLLPNQLGWETEGRPGKSICGRILLGCKFLRVLDLHNSGIIKVSHSISKLKHLRYLDLSRNMNIKRLPNSITKLPNLQTLKLSFCSRLQGLPRDTKNLVKLRNLEIDGCYNFTHMPLGLGQLTHLRTLSEFVLSKDSSSTRRYCGLGELTNLNNLQGQLLIKNLRHGVDYKAANLKEKQHLRSLILIWDTDVAALKVADSPQGSDLMNSFDCSNEDMAVEPYLESLKGLEPHIELKELSLSAYGGVQFPDWFALLTNLVRLSLWRCMKCQYLPPLDQFSSLKILVLSELTNLEYILGNVSNDNLTSTAVFSSLQELQLIELPKLKGWWRHKVEKLKRPSLFPRLSKLIIEKCPELTSMPLFPYVEELLELNNSSWMPFQHTMMSNTGSLPIATADRLSSATTSTSYSSSSFSPFSKLRCLRIVGIEEVEISDCDSIRWNVFQSLRSLTFDHLLQLKTLPQGLQGINSLQELHISRCNNLENIPDWITECKSLKKLAIRLLPNLTTFPEGIYSLTSSLNVEIEDCPKIAQNPNPLQDLVMKYLRTCEEYAKAKRHAEEEVVLNSRSYTWKQFEQSMMNTRGSNMEMTTTNHDASSNSQSTVPTFSLSQVSKFRTLRFDGIENLRSLPEWLNGLNCLKKLSIWNCPKLNYLSPGIQHFTSLQELDIYKCEELDMFNDDARMWITLRSLRYVTFHELPKLVDLPEGLQHVTALQKLHILDCNSFMTIPEWISNLKSVKEIGIWKCPELTSLPEAIRSLASLRKLEIVDCPILLKRCQRETGEDWPKIENVPNLYLGQR